MPGWKVFFFFSVWLAGGILFCFVLFCFVLIFIYLLRERERVNRGGTEREGDRIRSRLQARSCQHRARRGAWTHKLWDHDLSWSRMLSWLSHPGVPFPGSLKVPVCQWWIWGLRMISFMVNPPLMFPWSHPHQQKMCCLWQIQLKSDSRFLIPGKTE